jgi:hypothetical protein
MKLDMNKFNQRKSAVWRRLRKTQPQAETTKFYTEEELEAMTDEPGKNSGVMRLHTGELRLPKSLDEPESGKKADSAFAIMLVIIILMLTFIAIITYFVTQMPDKA